MYNFKTLSFNAACQAGTFGPSCTEECVSCLNNETCNTKDGTCRNGCVAGKIGPQCKTGKCSRSIYIKVKKYKKQCLL